MVTPEILQEELHIDGEEALLNSLIEEGKEYVMNAVNGELPESYFLKYRAYDRAVKSYATGLYYDRTGGTNQKGVTMGINFLRGKLLGVVDNENNTV